MEVDLIGYTITLKNGKELSYHTNWGSCTGMLMAASLVTRHGHDDLRASQAIKIKVEFENDLKPVKGFARLIKLLVPSAKIEGDTFTADIEGIPFDYVVCAIRLARYGNDGQVTYPDGCLCDPINLLGPTKSAVVARKSKRYDKWAFGEIVASIGYGRELCDFTPQQSWAALVSFSSEKRTRINKGLLPPLGGDGGCLGYYKDYEFFDYMMRVDRNPMYCNLITAQKEQLFNDLENIVNAMDDEAVPSVDWCLMGYGKAAFDHANKKYAEFGGGHNKFMDYIKRRLGGRLDIYDEDEDD